METSDFFIFFDYARFSFKSAVYTIRWRFRFNHRCQF